MCRFVFYTGPEITVASLVTEPVNSLVDQSFCSREREEPVNGDGFGLAYYVPKVSPVPGLFRAVSPAWNNRNLKELARVTRSHCILAHVRAATAGLPVAEVNCHPFVHRELAFMHNGEIGAFRVIRRRIQNQLSDEAFNVIEGSTDSEHLFAMFLDRYWKAKSDKPGMPESETMMVGLAGAVRDIVALTRAADSSRACYLNVAIGNGVEGVVCRCTSNANPQSADSLHLNTGRRYVCKDGVCRMVDPTEEGHAVIVSSEKLSDDPGWSTIPVNHMVVINAKRHVEIRPADMTSRD